MQPLSASFLSLAVSFHHQFQNSVAAAVRSPFLVMNLSISSMPFFDDASHPTKLANFTPKSSLPPLGVRLSWPQGSFLFTLALVLSLMLENSLMPRQLRLSNIFLCGTQFSELVSQMGTTNMHSSFMLKCENLDFCLMASLFR